MKRCPECHRDYYDDSLFYCLDDGNRLVEGPSSIEPETAKLPAVEIFADAETLRPAAPRITAGRRKHAQGDEAAFSHAPTGRSPTFGGSPWNKILARNKTRLLVASLVLTIGSVVGVAYLFLQIGSKAPAEHFRNIKLSRVTTEGNVDSVAMSADGKYIAYVVIDEAGFSLWTKHLPTNSRIKIASPAGVKDLYAAGFSPDGNYVYYTAQEPNNNIYEIYQVSVLGGSAKKVVSGVTGGIYFSPDGRQISYTRLDPATNEYSVVIADANGTNERSLAARKWPYIIGMLGDTWSRDGKTLAVALQPPGPDNDTVATIDTTDGAVTPICEKTFDTVGMVRWHHDGKGIVFTARESPFGPYSIWYLPSPGAEPRRVTNDFDSYIYYSLTAPTDDSSLVAVQSIQISGIYAAPATNLKAPARISAAGASSDGSAGVSWDDKGRLFYASASEGRSEVWMKASEADQPRVVTEGDAAGGVRVSPDGRYLLFESMRSGSRELWRTDIDGGNPKQLTSMNYYWSDVDVSPDSKWVIFSTMKAGIGRVSIDGGPVTELANAPSCHRPQFSPDGGSLAFETWDANGNQHLSVFRINGDALVPYKSIDLPPMVTPFHWSLDGRSVVYVRTAGPVSNLWKYPIDGSQPTPITDFKSDTIVDFAFSRDGKQIALARGPLTSDAVLITDIG